LPNSNFNSFDIIIFLCIGKSQLSIEISDGKMIISIQDDGKGFTQEALKDATNKFYSENPQADEELKFRLNLWMDKKPDAIYKDLGIESLEGYYLFEYNDYNLLVFESLEPKNAFYCFRNESIEKLLHKIKGLTKSEIFELSDMDKRGYHIEDRNKLESNVNSYFIKKYKISIDT